MSLATFSPSLPILPCQRVKSFDVAAHLNGGPTGPPGKYQTAKLPSPPMDANPE